MEELLLSSMLPAVPKQATSLAGGITMQARFCASILQLDPGICCVTQSTTELLENVQRCRYESEYTQVSEEQQLRFHITDLSIGYQYEFAGNESYYQITFLNNDDKLTVVVDNKQIDMVYLADDISKFVAIQESSRAISQSEKQFPVIRTATPRLS